MSSKEKKKSKSSDKKKSSSKDKKKSSSSSKSTEPKAEAKAAEVKKDTPKEAKKDTPKKEPKKEKPKKEDAAEPSADGAGTTGPGGITIPPRVGYEDMTKMEDMTLDGVLNNLSDRYEKNLIYVRILAVACDLFIVAGCLSRH